MGSKGMFRTPSLAFCAVLEGCTGTSSLFGIATLGTPVGLAIGAAEIDGTEQNQGFGAAIFACL
jgi:hypothetical protein